MKRITGLAMLAAATFLFAAGVSAQNVKRIYNDFEQFPCKLNEWNKAAGKVRFPAALFYPTVVCGNYLPGKNGQTIGMTMIETMPQTMTRPVPALT